jgi:hypothetical protein
MCGAHAVEHCRNLVTPVYAGHEQKAHFVDNVRLEKSAVDLSAAFEQRLFLSGSRRSSAAKRTRTGFDTKLSGRE